jgi:homoserine kinase
MITIKTPATSANLAVGFDSVGLALTLYNTFEIHPSETFIFKGFLEEIKAPEDLLFIKAYTHLATTYQTQIQPVSVVLKTNDIPHSRGLGSSASMIVAGMVASSMVHQLNLSQATIASHAALFEGHPDNVYACIFGGLTQVFKEGSKFFFKTSSVHQNYLFHLLIPSKPAKTQTLRDALPKKIPLEDAVYNLSRMSFLKEAFITDDFELLKNVLKDKLHQDYRFPFIGNETILKELNTFKDHSVTISGSGPSLLVISTIKSIPFISLIKETYTLLNVDVSQGTTVEGAL